VESEAVKGFPQREKTLHQKGHYVREKRGCRMWGGKTKYVQSERLCISPFPNQIKPDDSRRTDKQNVL